ncbi:hypothetical protein MPC4_140017 [Methylocella tundrae]|uniref:Uncharacterized protein n=1 Tax=Methylocella tundrae TaxID=227605 RepID=A0A8B6M2R2_METTU|nr:hypothetical protein MPC1_7280002 [Methylocella tundrae]VTZ49118.1 hypothetical protein MPC4_140017 [Methylocella tundrae]
MDRWDDDALESDFSACEKSTDGRNFAHAEGRKAEAAAKEHSQVTGQRGLRTMHGVCRA